MTRGIQNENGGKSMKQLTGMANDLLNLADEARRVAKSFDTTIERVSIVINDTGSLVMLQMQDGNQIDIMDNNGDFVYSEDGGIRHWEEFERVKAI